MVFLVLAIGVVLATVCVGYARWAERIDVSGQVATGTIAVLLTEITCDDPPGTLDPGHDKDVGCCVCQLVDVDGDGYADVAEVTVTNVYPGYHCTVGLTIRNDGTIPVCITDIRLVHDYDLEVLELEGFWDAPEFLGTQLYSGESISGSLSLHVEQAAGQYMAYSFNLEVEATQWNEADAGPENPGSETGCPPTVTCMWQQDTAFSSGGGGRLLEDGDPLHETSGAQFLPVLLFNSAKELQYWAIVSHPEDTDGVERVTVSVYHPVLPPEYGSKTCEPTLTEVDKSMVGIPAYETASNAGLVAYQDGYDKGKVIDELIDGRAEVYMVQGVLTYGEPAGDYRVVADACCSDGAYASDKGTSLENHFSYLGTCGIEIDFASINYGAIEVGTVRWIQGDALLDEPVDAAPDPNPATVRNVGNTNLQITVWQDDMGFGYSGSSEDPNWKVEYGARLGRDPANDTRYRPYDQ
ncbi:MAG: hypothetical protein HQ578_06430, partial [Chloroflexi bacterium]|nr:hypothetical protein [Chloroflexota bacterium]